MFLHIKKNPNKWIGIAQLMSINIPKIMFPKIAPKRPDVAVIESAKALKYYTLM